MEENYDLTDKQFVKPSDGVSTSELVKGFDIETDTWFDKLFLCTEVCQWARQSDRQSDRHFLPFEVPVYLIKRVQ